MIQAQRDVGVGGDRVLAQAIVDTVREPLLVLDKNLKVIAASRSFYATFQAKREETLDHLLHTLGDGQWDIPALRGLLEKVLPEHTVMEDYEVDHEFPYIGRRTMLLNARQVLDANEGHTILLAIEDVTTRRAIERELQQLLEQKDLLLDEMQHRIANSLQIIASILMLKARAVASTETRDHLEDAHNRVMSVAVVQKHLVPSSRGELIKVAPYLTTLCASLARSMVADSRPVLLLANSTNSSLASAEAVSIGLIVTECVINALKHAFRQPQPDARISVDYNVTDGGWTLSIADNGTGVPIGLPTTAKHGLGTSIIQALAQQLKATVRTVSTDKGTSISVVHVAAAKVLAVSAA